MGTYSHHIRETKRFKTLIDNVRKTSSHIIVITEAPLSVYIKKAIKEYSNKGVFIYNYHHFHFSVELMTDPKMQKHYILSEEEVEELLSHLLTNKRSLPYMNTDDVAFIWLGAKKGDIIKIQGESELCGQYVRYRLVSDEIMEEQNVMNKEREKRKLPSKVMPLTKKKNVKKIKDPEPESEDDLAEPEPEDDVFDALLEEKPLNEDFDEDEFDE